MKIEVFSDIACPFCYIGKRKLEEALQQFTHANQVEVIWKSYQLDPNALVYNGQDYYESLAAKFGSIEQAKQMTANVAQQAKQIGLSFHFDTMKTTNTIHAHRLLQFAKTEGKAGVVKAELFQAHFTDGKDVANLEVLALIAANAGLPASETKKVLEDPQSYHQEVIADIDEAKEFGVTGVPYFIFNRKYAISGAQPTETFLQALQKVWEEEQSAAVFESLTPESDQSAACQDGSCDTP